MHNVPILTARSFSFLNSGIRPPASRYPTGSDQSNSRCGWHCGPELCDIWKPHPHHLVAEGWCVSVHTWLQGQTVGHGCTADKICQGKTPGSTLKHCHFQLRLYITLLLTSNSIPVDFKVVCTTPIMSLANPCCFVNKACVSASSQHSVGCQSVVAGLKWSLWSWTLCSSCQSASTVVLFWFFFCVCVSFGLWPYVQPWWQTVWCRTLLVKDK